MIPREEVLNLAELARLELTQREVEALQKDISSILEYVGQVSAIELPDKKEDKPVMRNVMREDAPRAEGHPMQGKEEAVRAAFPTQEKNFNVVRKIIQKDE